MLTSVQPAITQQRMAVAGAHRRCRWRTQAAATLPPRRRRLCPRAEQQQQQQAEEAAYADPNAHQRAELGRRVVRHLTGEPQPDLGAAVTLLPVLVQAPRAWHTNEAGVAERGGAALRAALAPRRYAIPSWGSLPQCRCQLASSRSGRRFRAREVNLFLALLFEQVGGTSLRAASVARRLPHTSAPTGAPP